MQKAGKASPVFKEKGSGGGSLEIRVGGLGARTCVNGELDAPLPLWTEKGNSDCLKNRNLLHKVLRNAV